jgi:hypothetical protein
MGGPRTDFTFPRAIEAQLLADGRPCEVRAITTTSELTSKILRTWEEEILGFSPDVIILDYGHYECVHLFLPRWLERHANSLRARPLRLESFYRKVILRPIWRILAQIQARLDRVVPTIRKGLPRRIAADLERYIAHVQKIQSPLVLLLELHHPSSKREQWFPGIVPRVDLMNQTIADMVARVNKTNVRIFPINELIDKHYDGNLELALADGFHFTPLLHREIGTAMAQHISEWADTQPHLTREQE